MIQPLQLNDIRDFHKDVLTICEAGIPIGLLHSQSDLPRGALAERLLNLEAQAGAAGARGDDLEQFVRQQNLVAEDYGPTLLAWHYSSRTPQALHGLVVSTALRQSSRAAFLAALVQPACVLGLAFFALLFVCLILVPRFKHMQLQSGQPAGPVLRVLSFLQEWQVVWMTVLPILACCILYVLTRRRHWQSLKLRRRVSTLLSDLQVMSRATLLAQRGVDVDRAIAISDTAPRGAKVIQKSTPLLAWAIGEPGSGRYLNGGEVETAEQPERSQRLRQVAGFYAELTQSIVRGQLKFSSTRIVLTILCALVVLLVGLSVFGPVVEQMFFLAVPPPD